MTNGYVFSTVLSSLGLIVSVSVAALAFRMARRTVKRDELADLRAEIASLRIELAACEQRCKEEVRRTGDALDRLYRQGHIGEHER